MDFEPKRDIVDDSPIKNSGIALITISNLRINISRLKNPKVAYSMYPTLYTDYSRQMGKDGFYNFTADHLIVKFLANNLEGVTRRALGTMTLILPAALLLLYGGYHYPSVPVLIF
jgi:hypothetical protein